RYSIHIANPATGAELQRYDFQFSRVDAAGGGYKNLDTILRYGRGADVNGMPDAGAIMNVGDAHQNFVQTYTVTKFVDATGASTVLGTGLKVPPYNTGPRITPLYNDLSGTSATNRNYGRAVSGASTRASLDTYTRETVYDLPGVPAAPNGVTTFAGVREDGFYADTPGIFDLLDPRILIPSGSKPAGVTAVFGQAGGGVDGFKGYNVFHYAITIPLADLPAPMPYAAPFSNGMAPGVDTRMGVGVYASVARPRITLRNTSGINANSGPFIQVNREANPLFNEVLVALRDKDNYNRDSPTNDVAKYQKYALNPEVGVLINALYGSALPGPIVTTNRTDLAAVYTPDVIRVDTTTGPVHAAGETGFSRLSFLGGDTLTGTDAGGNPETVPGGWPNGRRLGDDVIDIALTAVASGPSYSNIVLIGDNVAANDQVYNMTFPYAATPWGGTHNSKDSSINVGF
ncbi:MAG: DUF4331 family protein, partial [Armatimonadetes bacterium]|nr:DUF4331 family protein [Armatimonadota bacterium]